MDCRRIAVLVVGLLASTLATGKAVARPGTLTEAITGTLTVTLEAGGYVLREGDDGQTHIQMDEDFGCFGEPGEPELPGRAFLIALPPGARVIDVHFATPDPVSVPGHHQIAPVGLAVSEPRQVERATAEWEAERERAYVSDEPYPGEVGTYLGQGQWRRYTYARVAFQPFSYRPRSGALRFHPALVVTIEYRLPEPGSLAWREVERLRDDRVMDDVIADHLVNFDQARAWYDSTSSLELGASSLAAPASQYDYVIIVENDAMATTVDPFKTWKETLGHTVRVVTLEWVHANYSGADVAEEVWNFLHAKYPSGEWGIRYVLLVGDLRVIPRRLVFYSNPHKEWGLQSDHFFAKLSGGDTSAQVWNSDGDRRWGEIDGDEMSVVPDVLVGRIPLNDATSVGNAIQAMIAFEQDNGTWKHRALLAGGYNDIKSATQKTDNAVLMEYIHDHLLDPNGWSETRIYEQTGLGTSPYTPAPDYDTSRANVVTGWNANAHGLAVFADHGFLDGTGLTGHVWQHDTLTTTNQVDPGEWAWSSLFTINDVAALTTTHPSIVELLGCATLALTRAPWLSPTLIHSQKPGFSVDRTLAHAPEDDENNDLGVQTGKNLVSPQAVTQAGQPHWAFTGQAGQAFRVAGLARHPDGMLYAAATTSEVDSANTGAVFRSDDGGTNWEPVPALPHAWWLDSILITDGGTLLVGGMMYEPQEPDSVARGAVYRSTDLGEHWSVVVDRAGTGSVHTLVQRNGGIPDLFANRRARPPVERRRARFTQ